MPFPQGGIKIDATRENISEARVRIPTGEYLLAVVGFAASDGGQNGSPNYRFTCEVLDGAYTGKRVPYFCSMNDAEHTTTGNTAQFALVTLLHAASRDDLIDVVSGTPLPTMEVFTDFGQQLFLHLKDVAVAGIVEDNETKGAQVRSVKSAADYSAPPLTASNLKNFTAPNPALADLTERLGTVGSVAL